MRALARPDLEGLKEQRKPFIDRCEKTYQKKKKKTSSILLRHNHMKGLRSALRVVSGGLCYFCERWLAPGDGEVVLIAPYSKRPDLVWETTNWAYGCTDCQNCWREEAPQKELLHPFHPAVDSAFVYQVEGNSVSMQSEDTRGQASISSLGLNDPLLCEKRGMVWREVLELWKDQRNRFQPPDLPARSKPWPFRAMLNQLARTKPTVRKKRVEPIPQEGSATLFLGAKLGRIDSFFSGAINLLVEVIVEPGKASERRALVAAGKRNSGETVLKNYNTGLKVKPGSNVHLRMSRCNENARRFAERFETSLKDLDLFSTFVSGGANIAIYCGGLAVLRVAKILAEEATPIGEMIVGLKGISVDKDIEVAYPFDAEGDEIVCSWTLRCLPCNSTSSSELSLTTWS